MLQFISILGISTLLSVAAYKIQHDEINEKQTLLLGASLASENMLDLGSKLN